MPFASAMFEIDETALALETRRLSPERADARNRHELLGVERVDAGELGTHELDLAGLRLLLGHQPLDVLLQLLDPCG